MIEAIPQATGLTRLVRMSCSLDDRLAGIRGGAPTTPPSGQGASRLTMWRDLVAPGSPAEFTRRLAWDALDDVAARAVATPFGADDPAAALPAWAHTFRRAYGSSAEELAAAFVALPRSLHDRLIDPADPIAFEPLFLPVVAHAAREVRARTGRDHARLSEAAHTTLERQLLGRLAFICERALYTEFSVFRHMGQWTAVAGSLNASAGPSRVLYDAFVRQMAGGGLFAFFQRFSVAARLCATVAELWIEATAEFIARLAQDLAGIRELFQRGEPLGRVAGLRVSQGDAHDGGRCVAIVQFESGLRVVYKPRPLVLEGLYAELVDRINGSDGIALELRYPRRLERPSHGWVEFIEHRPCESLEAVHRFYYRTGMALALVYGVNGTDFHLENLIAHGDQPVLIDMEALLSHRLFIEGSVNDRAVGSVRDATDLVRASVHRTGLLPVLRFSSDGRHAGNLGGLASDEDPSPLPKAAYWRHLNTDLMKLGTRAATMPETVNAPVFEGRPRFASDHVEEIVRGFRQVYTLLLAQRDELLAADGLFSRWGSKPVRFLFRHTSLYGAALVRTVDPKYLTDGAMRFIQLDALAKPLLSRSDRPELPRILAAERRALERMDIPLFVAASDSRALDLPDGDHIEDFFDRSALEEATERLAALSEADLAFQVELIRMGLAAGAARGLEPPVPPGPAAAGTAADAARADDLMPAAVREAERVARMLEARAIGARGDLSWIGIRAVPRARRFMVSPLDHSLFDGYSGIAFFLAGVCRATGDARYRELALSTLFPLREQIARLARGKTADGQEIGAAHGCGSAIFALVRMAEFLDDAALLDEARMLAELITPEAVSAATPDLLTGRAGAILGLLPLYRATGEAGVLERAVGCGRRLCEGWEADDALEPSLPHGTAGIALALYRLYGQTGTADFREAADAALDHAERACAGAIAAGADVPADWGRGLVGLAFAQLAACERGCRRDRLETTLGWLETRVPEGLDSLCSGGMGYADVLATVALELGTPDRLARARALGHRVVDRRAGVAGHGLGWGSGYEHLGLFQGSPGVAYQLLRLAAPERFPSVLCWQDAVPPAGSRSGSP